MALRSVDRIALAALCLLLVLSLSMRMIPRGGGLGDAQARGQADAVDLKDGVVPHRATFWSARTGPPIPVESVQPSPHGTDAALAGPRNKGDRVFYAYHSWLLGGRFAATELTILHFVRRGASVLRLNGTAGRDTLSVKLTMRVGCEAAPGDALIALRREEEERR